jgi:ribosome biogenesis protein Nip4
MKPLEDFANKLNAQVSLHENFIVKRASRYFLLNERLKSVARKDFYYAGAYLGKIKNGIFFPSFILLTMIAEEEANKMSVDDKTAWLFTCGRDVFGRGILRVSESRRKGDYTLILNQRSECLGFGRILLNIREKINQSEVVVKNISDIGDFLRRER